MLMVYSIICVPRKQFSHLPMTRSKTHIHLLWLANLLHVLITWWKEKYTGSAFSVLFGPSRADFLRPAEFRVETWGLANPEAYIIMYELLWCRFVSNWKKISTCGFLSFLYCPILTMSVIVGFPCKSNFVRWTLTIRTQRCFIRVTELYMYM